MHTQSFIPHLNMGTCTRNTGSSVYTYIYTFMYIYRYQIPFTHACTVFHPAFIYVHIYMQCVGSNEDTYIFMYTYRDEISM